MKPYLPQKDPNYSERENSLQSNREQYQFQYIVNDTIPVLTPVPKQDYFTPEYTAKRLASMANLPANMLAAKTKNFLDPLDTLEEYSEELLILLPKPNLIEYYRNDDFFGEQRLSGANPMAIRRIDELPENFAVDNALFQSVVGSERSLNKALEEGKIYFLDYPFLENIKGGNVNGVRKYIPKTRALFYFQSNSDSTGGKLVPVAIELKSDSAQNRLIYTPKDNELDWFFAKLCLQVVDANHQELGTHFSFTHAVMAPFAVVSARQLAQNHPITILLEPHFQFMLYDNYLGLTSFLNEGGPVDNFMPGSLDESLNFIRDTYNVWNLNDFAFPTEISNRKMDDPEILPHYPFRDDGMLIWNEVKNFVTTYLKLYYKTPEDISQDYELQNWARELAAQDGGRVKGMPETIESIEQLIDIITIVVFSCAPLHSALNFAQYEFMAYVPNMPYASYHPVPENKGIDMETILKFLPPFKQAADQVFWTMVLTSYQHDKLGHYDQKFEDPLAQDTVIQFQQNLANIERQIDVKNQTRIYPYTYFKPSNIMNSINT
ncbi:MAG: lipoxygenase [Moorea sp. SIO4A3]|nr:lipoxygenase [Moorena sp. SIO4A3]